MGIEVGNASRVRAVLLTMERAMADYAANPSTESRPATDTIAAISTPPGRGGIGILRLGGPMATSITAQLVRLRQPLEHARARLADVHDAGAIGVDSDRIDEAVVTFFA